jgi:hypothetical protein
MSKVCVASIVSLLLSACASVPVFQKQADSGVGYKIQDLDSTENFRATVQLPPETSEKFIRNYAFRAVGEECEVRGFQFFDVGQLNATSFEGFCYLDSTRKSLALTFEKGGLEESPQKFVIEELNSKSNTKLQIGDEVISISGKNPTSMAEIKSIVFDASSKKLAALPLKITRKGKELTVTEPMTDLKNGALGKPDLEALRTLVK